MHFARRVSTPSAARAPRHRRAARPVCEPVEPRRLLAVAPAGVALDTTYGGDGRALTPLDVNGGFDAVALPSGKLLVAGSAGIAAPMPGMLVRLNPDGSADATFEDDGTARLPLPDGFGALSWRAVVPLADGDALVAGEGAWQEIDGTWTYRPVVARYNDDGRLDPAFGGDSQSEFAGVVVPTTGTRRNFVRDMVVLPGGKILVGGHVQSDPPNDLPDLALWRFNADGTPDTTFGADGFRRQDIEGEDYLSSLAALGDGGFWAETTRGVVAFNPDGTLRGPVGPQRTHPVMGDGIPDGVMAATDDGKVVVVTADTDSGGSGDLTVRRYLDNGTPDPSFGSGPGGGTTFDPGALYAMPTSVDALPDGSVLVTLWDSGVQRATVLRISPDASFDTHFGVDGLLPLPIERISSFLSEPQVTAAGDRLFALGDVTGVVGALAYKLNPGIVADPGGPYGPVDEGGTFTASAAGSSSSGSPIVRYEWDGNYNGVEFRTNAEGTTPAVTVHLSDESPPPKLVLRVTTADGLQALSPHPAQILGRNMPPVFQTVRVPTAVPLGFQTAVQGTVADPGGDPIAVTVDFGDGTPPVEATVTSNFNFNTAGHRYAARGTYHVTITARDNDGGTSTVGRDVVVADVVGNVFHDTDDDGRRLPTDPPFPGVTVYADANANGALDDGEPRTTTDAAGDYHFARLPNGTYVIRVVPPPGTRFNLLTPGFQPVVIDDDGPGATRDFGLTDRARITGVVWEDLDADGVRDDGEASLTGGMRNVYLDLDNDGWYDADEPKAGISGPTPVQYFFTNLAPGTYTARYLPGLVAGNARDNESAQTFPNARGGQSGHTVTVGPGEISSGNDFGSFFGNTPITGTVYLDRNRDGQRSASPVQSGEVALPGRVVYLDADGDGALDPDESRSVVAANAGTYFLPVIRDRTYTVRTVLPEGWTQSQPAGGAPYVLTVDQQNTAALQGKDFGTHVIAAPAVVGRHLFYFRSAFSGTHPVHPENDAAIAPDKAALLPGQTATFANVSSYNLGLNGVMVDLNDLARIGSTNVLRFDVGDGTTQPPTGWTQINPSMSVEIRRGAGIGGSDRLVAVFATDSIRNKWLRVTVLPGTGSGLSRPDVFYFGHLQGETGAGDPFKVNALDIAALKRNLTTEPVGVGNPYDLNRDSRVNALDLAALKANLIRSLVAFTPTPPPAPAPAPSATAWLAASEDEA